MNKFKRSKMHLEDMQVRIFNGRGWVCPIQYSTTGFLEPNFAKFHSYYAFWFDFLDTESNTIIRDNVSKIWKTWIEEGKGTDPLGSNFRKNFEKLMVSQDEYWEPGLYTRNAVFNKKIENSIVDFSLKTETVVHHEKDKVFLKLIFKNNADKPKNIQLLPNHELKRKDIGKIQKFSENEINIDGKTSVSIQSTLPANKNGFLVELKANEQKEVIFAFNFWREKTESFEHVCNSLEDELNSAKENSRNRIKKLKNSLPTLKTDYKPFKKLYYGSITTLNECIWNRDDFIANPFWASGSWIFTINWDLCFSKEVIALMDTKIVEEFVWNPIIYGKTRKTWVSWKKDQSREGGGIFYLQELPSTVAVLETYLNHSKDWSILTQEKEGKTLLEWLKKWARDILDEYENEDNLIDVGEDTEVLVEIRTDGYGGAVPNTNILFADVMLKLSKYCKYINDSDYEFFSEKAKAMQKSINGLLWDEKNWWFSNLYNGKDKENIYAYHLFDALGTESITYEQKMKLISHIKESEFLGKYGFFSISKQDTRHYDRIDADWGGGGQFAGMPGRIATYCFKLGAPLVGHEILKKLSRWTDVFPYQPQNARTEQPLIDLSSMAIQIAAGASLEAIIFGIFGINLKPEEIVISPNYNEAYGNTSIENIKIDDLNISIHLLEDKYEVFVNGSLQKNFFYGEKFKIKRN